MAARRVLIDYNDLTDVVSVYVEDTKSASYRPSPSDNHLMIERDLAGEVVGVEVLGATVMTAPVWKRHPERHHIPADILVELDRWLAHWWADVQAAG